MKMQNRQFENEIIELCELFKNSKYKIGYEEEGFHLTLEDNGDKPNLSIFYDYNENLKCFCYYVGIDNMKAQILWVGKELYGFDYFKTFADFEKSLQIILNDSYYIKASSLSFMPPVIIKRKDFNAVVKTLKQINNIQTEADLYNYSSYGMWHIYSSNGEYIKAIFPTKSRLSLAPKYNNPIKEILLAYYEGESIYYDKKNQIALFSYDEDNLILKSMDGSLIRKIPNSSQGIFLLGTAFDEVHSQLYDINGKLILTFCEKNDIALELQEKYPSLSFGILHLTEFIASFASQRMLYSTKYQSYVTLKYFNKLIGKD